MSDEDDIEKKLLERLNIRNAKDITKEILNNINANEAKILRKKFGVELISTHSIEEVGEQFDITRKRIQEIEEKALKKLGGKNKDGDNHNND